MREDASAGGEVQNYVDGEWRPASGDDGRDVVDPATRDTVASVTYSTAADIDDAVSAGKAAFETWRSTPVEERIQPLFELKRLLEANQDDIAEALVREHGKTFDEAKGELRRGIENVEVACGIPSMMQAGHLPNAAPGIDETAVRKPLGVFAAVTPFNFPGMIPLWFLPYAVATGNAFVLKPSEKTPVTARLIFELVDEAGFPDGVVQLVNGGADTVNALVEHDGVEGISFVGSTPVAKHVYKTAAAHGKRVQAQGGAKNHIVVAASANLDFAAEQTIGSAFANTGQRCLANPVAVVEDAIYDEFAECVVDIAAGMTLDNGLSEDVDMGPLISGAARDRVKEYVETGVEEGATLLYDGRDADVPAEGSFLGPTVFGDVSPDDTIAREEIFGPVLALVRADDFDHAVEVVNRSEFGNASSLFTDRGADAKRFRHEVEAGNLAVNAGTAAPMAFFHFGGWKDSFFGDLHAQGDDAIRFYTDEAVYIERWPDA
ncbi:CoA-acylating methylmalonate-semialdehyde dehydrogenase [Haloferax volcanii]|uniref:methylmalonate-semialdehyde dehydrogenase (CoA acylating) n=3 Tax=Haloferax volcanii TaxID=2246 RepID=A0A384KKH1_HALVD|nr:CoA-acylating methylmalonate-semialdehyde dehydrogenase [Haloferax volcanii]ADE01887.1 methylmalonate-semialdehyde dehydrogenase [Haloferax volcanii DS2]ELY31426.1 methylmalonate-semialdehyde dehydrogenase [Haloferax volcanii DS2]MBS8120760.1 CoA-acylating methylmalonate-semialdehyde dehydrogenase [Haloferax volcanii]MBS8125797.1 CoA-acylating methylmalonate-semialdehyde dehydrogenase [Haloferax volcanii]MBS8129581.1 CoA-acylating methylmalonate-semialdehyde dehydrogenase [Haloferax volcani